MKYIYLLLWFSFENISKADRRQYEGYERGHLSGHVVGGVEVPITMYPHVALLVFERRYLCGGSIISDRLVLTAAHCLIGTEPIRLIEPKAIEVFVGSTYRQRGTKYLVCKVQPHELYLNNNHRPPAVYLYDIAVVMLTKQIKFGPTVQKVEIAPDKSWRKENHYFTTAGFGLDETTGLTPSRLLATRMHYVDSRICNQSQANSKMLVPSHMFCMVGQRWTGDCYGDSGSGVIWRGYIVGVVSTGRDAFCGSDMIPSMYTDVTYFKNWVQTKINESNSLQNQVCQSNNKKQRNLVNYKNMSPDDYYE